MVAGWPRLSGPPGPGAAGGGCWRWRGMRSMPLPPPAGRRWEPASRKIQSSSFRRARPGRPFAGQCRQNGVQWLSRARCGQPNAAQDRGGQERLSSQESTAIAARSVMVP
jgi:hypothetical protein